VAVDANVMTPGEGVVEATGAVGFGTSPKRLNQNHTIFELSFRAMPGKFGVQLHDPGPRFGCEVLETEVVHFVGHAFKGSGARVTAVDRGSFEAAHAAAAGPGAGQGAEQGTEQRQGTGHGTDEGAGRGAGQGNEQGQGSSCFGDDDCQALLTGTGCVSGSCVVVDPTDSTPSVATTTPAPTTAEETSTAEAKHTRTLGARQSEKEGTGGTDGGTSGTGGTGDVEAGATTTAKVPAAVEVAVTTAAPEDEVGPLKASRPAVTLSPLLVGRVCRYLACARASYSLLPLGAAPVMITRLGWPRRTRARTRL